MRPPNYRIGWYIPQQIAALTHLHPEVTTADFQGVVQEGAALLQSVNTAFHIIIDNRQMELAAPVRLSQMQLLVPYMNHPQLRWVVVVKPMHVVLSTEHRAIEQAGSIHLKNVASLPDAIQFLQQTTPGLHWDQADVAFFPAERR